MCYRLHRNTILTELQGFASCSVDFEDVVPGRKVHLSSTKSVLKRSVLEVSPHRRVMKIRSLGVYFSDI